MYKIALLAHGHLYSVAVNVRVFKQRWDRNKLRGNLFLQKETDHLKQDEKVP